MNKYYVRVAEHSGDKRAYNVEVMADSIEVNTGLLFFYRKTKFGTYNMVASFANWEYYKQITEEL